MFSVLSSFVQAHPLALALLLVLSYLTSPVELVKIAPILLIKLPFSILRSSLCFLAPSIFERDVRDDVVFVTGAASGLGKLIAHSFASLGAAVVMIDKDEDALRAAQTEIRANLNACDKWRTVPYAFTADLCDREATYSVMKQAAAKAGPCTILINNAGIVTGKKLLDSSDDDIERSMRVNALAHFWTVRAVLPAMIESEQPGHIVTIASSAGLLGIPGLADYCASKFAAVGLDESIRFELRKLGTRHVRTTCVCPFFIDTGMFSGAACKFPRLTPFLTPEYAVHRIVRAIRCGQPTLFMPLSVHLIPLIKAILPHDILADLAMWFGVLDTMDDFRGRAAAGSSTQATSRKAENHDGRQQAKTPRSHRSPARGTRSRAPPPARAPR